MPLREVVCSSFWIEPVTPSADSMRIWRASCDNTEITLYNAEEHLLCYNICYKYRMNANCSVTFVMIKCLYQNPLNLINIIMWNSEHVHCYRYRCAWILCIGIYCSGYAIQIKYDVYDNKWLSIVEQSVECFVQVIAIAIDAGGISSLRSAAGRLSVRTQRVRRPNSFIVYKGPMRLH